MELILWAVSMHVKASTSAMRASRAVANLGLPRARPAVRMRVQAGPEIERAAAPDGEMRLDGLCVMTPAGERTLCEARPDARIPAAPASLQASCQPYVLAPGSPRSA
jgi:hypothetical protein